MAFGAFALIQGFAASSRPLAGLDGRLIVGYQGWFGCPNDASTGGKWQHWFIGQQGDVGQLSVEMLPAIGAYDAHELCQTGMKTADGSPVLVYSAQSAAVVAQHFKWMAQNAIDGAAAQRFVGPLANPAALVRSDRVVQNVMAAAQANGRVFFVTYDISGANPATVVADIRRDWQHLVNDLKLTSSPAYLRVNDKPLLELWGFGFSDRPGEPGEVTDLIRNLKSGSSGIPGVTLMGGVPANWRTLSNDSKSDPAWRKIYLSFDVVSPWIVGRFKDEASDDDFVRSHVVPDLGATDRAGIGYMPVIFPGFSWRNLQAGRGNAELAIPNQIPRRCGNFLWHQVHSLIDAGVRTLYAAMFDEVDEGTALFPIVTRSEGLPRGATMVYLNQDGCELPDDWYLRVTGQAAKYLREHRVPPVQLSEVIRP